MSKFGSIHTIAFDVNGVLVGSKNSETLINLLKVLKSAGHHIIVWSGNGKEYVEEVVKELNLESYVDEYSDKLLCKSKPEIAIEDDKCAFALGTIATILV